MLSTHNSYLNGLLLIVQWPWKKLVGALTRNLLACQWPSNHVASPFKQCLCRFLVLHPRTPPLNCSYSEDVIWQLCPLNSPQQKARLLHKPQSPWKAKEPPKGARNAAVASVYWNASVSCEVCTPECLHSLFSTSSCVPHTHSHTCMCSHAHKHSAKEGRL